MLMSHRHIDNRITSVLLALLLALLLVACGGASSQAGSGPDTPARPAPRLDSCVLLTQAEVETLLGAPVAAPSADLFGGDDPQDERMAAQCLYHTSGDDYKSVSVLVRRGAAGEDARDSLQQIRTSNALGGAFEPVAGLGDDALWNHGGDSDQLTVAHGRFLVIASADLGKDVPTFDISKAVAQRVLERLP
jgi:hypothetical protein